MSDAVNKPRSADDKPEAVKARDTVNPGDVIDPDKSFEEKTDQVAVKYDDVMTNTNVVPTYFEVEGEDGEKEALHHVEDAEEISDVVRQARVNEDGERTWD